MITKSKERNKYYENAILRNADRLYDLVTRMLDVARIESQTLKLDKTVVDLNEKISNVIRDVTQETSVNKTNSVPIMFEPKGKINVLADKARLFQVFSNLLTNAIKFTREGNIIISATKSDATNEAIVSIKDTGAGLDPDIVPDLFSKFKTKSDKGIGLGLYITKSIVEAHGGKIDAKSNIDSKGSTFTVTLPLGS